MQHITGWNKMLKWARGIVIYIHPCEWLMVEAHTLYPGQTQYQPTEIRDTYLNSITSSEWLGVLIT